METSSSDLQELLELIFKHREFRPGQEEALEILVKSQDLLVVMPTGAGKSLIYQLGTFFLPDMTLVVSPLIALMKDQVDSLHKLKIPATALNSSLSVEEKRIRLAAIMEKKIDILYVAPERLRNKDFQEILSKVDIGLLVVDEAHCLSQWGKDFRPDYLSIAEARKLLGQPTTLAVTATATPKVQEEILEHLEIFKAKRLVTGFNRSNLFFEVWNAPGQVQKLSAIDDFLPQDVEPGIIYVGTRKHAELVANFICRELGMSAYPYHGGMSADKRRSIQDDFMSGRIHMVVATNAFGLGIDRPDLRFVLHFELPGSLEAYYQEAGRAGRDGHPARCVLLYGPGDRWLQDFFIENDAPSRNELWRLYRALSGLARSKKVVVELEELSDSLELHPVKTRLGLQLLKNMEAIEEHWTQGRSFHIRMGSYRREPCDLVMQEVEERRRYKLLQLEEMISYCETTSCRRRIFLDHFGDLGPTTALRCCDNCEDLHS